MYKLRTNEDLTTTQLYYNSNVGNCAERDLQCHLLNVINPRIIVKIEERVLENQGLYNVYFEDGTFAFCVNPDRLLVDDYDALKELSIN